MQTTILIVAIAIFLLSLVLKQKRFLTPSAITQKISQGALIIDVRTPAEYADGHIKVAKNVPLQTIADQCSTLPKDKDIIVYCLSGNRSNQAIAMLKQAGVTRVFNGGGYERMKGIVR
jgi:phage shock protein E